MEKNNCENTAPKPGDYSLGSLESRAAARALLKDRASKQNTITIIHLDTNGKEIRRTVSPTPADESLTIICETVDFRREDE